jgi:hypothetical protein
VPRGVGNSEINYSLHKQLPERVCGFKPALQSAKSKYVASSGTKSFVRM